MGKKRHAQDKLYITHKEWAEHGGGHREAGTRHAYRRLPFQCCALSLAPFEHPVMVADGTVFELTQM